MCRSIKWRMMALSAKITHIGKGFMGHNVEPIQPALRQPDLHIS